MKRNVLVILIAVVIVVFVFSMKSRSYIRQDFIKFSNGVEFLGCNIESEKVILGSKFKINYFWKIKKKIEHDVFVFVHFVKDGRIVFQNDHPLLEGYRKMGLNLKSKIWGESCEVKVPVDIPCGEYMVRIGLWIPGKKNERIEIAGSKDISVEVYRFNIIKYELPKDIGGKIVFQSDMSGNKEIYVMNTDGRIKKLTFTNADNEYPNWSPDGKSIVFQSYRDGNSEIYNMDRDGSNQRRLTDHPGNDTNPSWHPDGKRIIFTSDRDGAINFYFVNIDGSGLEKITDFKDKVHNEARVSPDGKKIVFTSDMSLGWQVFMYDMETKEIKQLTDIPCGHCESVWSHDGEKIAFVSRLGTENSDIWIMDKDGGNKKRITTHPALDYKPRFSRDDKKVIFSTERDGNWEIYLMDIDKRIPVRITYTDYQEEWPDIF